MARKISPSPRRKLSPKPAAKKPRAPAPSKPQPVSSAAGPDTPDQVRGRVVGYTVGRKGLVVKLDVSAIYRLAFSVEPDEPHFRSAVSMTMLALANRMNPNASGDHFDYQYLWVWLEKGTEGQDIRPASVVAASYNNDANPFDIEGFVFSPNDL